MSAARGSVNGPLLMIRARRSPPAAYCTNEMLELSASSNRVGQNAVRDLHDEASDIFLRTLEAIIQLANALVVKLPE